MQELGKGKADDKRETLREGTRQEIILFFTMPENLGIILQKSCTCERRDRTSREKEADNRRNYKEKKK